MIEILTDSCSDLSQDLIDKYHIRVLPLWVFINNQLYRDGVEIKLDDLFQFVLKTGQLPKTSAPSINDFQEFWSGVNQAIYIGVSQKLSATYDVAMQALTNSKGKDIRIIDSKNLSTGIGLLVLEAAELQNQGKNLDEIEKIILSKVSKVKTAFVIDTLEYLYKGGRCSAIENIVGSLLKIRPVIEVRQDGTLGVKEKISGSRKKALSTMLTNFQKALPEIDMRRVFITHTNCIEDAVALKKSLLEMAPIEEVDITSAGATIASHCGPNTIGILYMTK